MTTPSQDALLAAMEATWPPAATWPLGPFLLRDGAGGGKRVSAATVQSDWQPEDIALAETAMAEPLFLLRQQDVALDAALKAKGYQILDPVVVYAAPVEAFPEPAIRTSFPHWPPLQIAVDLWAAGQIGPERLAVMHRAQTPKTTLLARQNDRAVGVAYVAVHHDLAMLHALEVSPAHRRQGVAQNLLAAAAHWSAGQGATTLSLVVTAANHAARALYDRMGMQPVARYHYRQKAAE